jgi:hypothetical protein
MIYNNIDILQNNIDTAQNFILLLTKELEKYIDEKRPNEEKQLINIKSNDRDGYYLLITNKRCSILKNKLEKVDKIKIGNITLNISDLEFSQLPKSSNTKINCMKIKEISNNIVEYKKELALLLKEHFRLDITNIYEQYIDTFQFWTKKIAYIDFT